MTATSSHVKRLCYCALSVALIAVCSWIAVPTVVPFTLQTFAIFAVLGLLGGRLGTASIVCYLLVGLAGLPVFAGFSGGVGAFVGPTGGYLIGFVFMGLLYWLCEKKIAGRAVLSTVCLFFGLLVLYAFGTAWFILVYLQQGTAMSVGTVLGFCVLPFILPDCIKLFLAQVLTKRLSRHVHL